MMEAKMFCYQSYGKGNGFADVRGTWNISRYR